MQCLVCSGTPVVESLGLTQCHWSIEDFLEGLVGGLASTDHLAHFEALLPTQTRNRRFKSVMSKKNVNHCAV